jgi:hypothetical protein
MTNESISNTVTPKRCRWPRLRLLGITLYQGEFHPSHDEPYTTVTERGALIGMHPIDPDIYKGGRVATSIGVGRLSCLIGLVTGHLTFEATAHLWHPPNPHKSEAGAPIGSAEYPAGYSR